VVTAVATDRATDRGAAGGAARFPESAVAQAISRIPDPEVPVVTIFDLGILRGVEVDESARAVVVTVTPTYSGCPAMEAIADRIVFAAHAHGYAATVRTRLSPPWTTDWITEEGREALHRFGIAPPGPASGTAVPGPVPVSLGRHVVACPRCGSDDTTEIAHFGSTACKALRRCNACREPFDEFKAL
jgi:ring-1,2-phenylacetyl-CoA epoxidase subunit PaaD